VAYAVGESSRDWLNLVTSWLTDPQVYGGLTRPLVNTTQLFLADPQAIRKNFRKWTTYGSLVNKDPGFLRLFSCWISILVNCVCWLISIFLTHIIFPCFWGGIECRFVSEEFYIIIRLPHPTYRRGRLLFLLRIFLTLILLLIITSSSQTVRSFALIFYTCQLGEQDENGIVR
jgi:hypothetical protein